MRGKYREFSRVPSPPTHSLPRHQHPHQSGPHVTDREPAWTCRHPESAVYIAVPLAVVCPMCLDKCVRTGVHRCSIVRSSRTALKSTHFTDERLSGLHLFFYFRYCSCEHSCVCLSVAMCLVSAGCLCGGRIAGSWDVPVSALVGISEPPSQRSGIRLLCLDILVAPCPCQHLVLSVFLFLAVSWICDGTITLRF